MLRAFTDLFEELTNGRNPLARRHLARLRRLRFEDSAGHPHNIEEFLHGYCDQYIAYFLSLWPDWQGEVLIRKSNGKIVHAYAFKDVEAEAKADHEAPSAGTSPRSGSTIDHKAPGARTSPRSHRLYADARGITSDQRAFFSQYRFRESEVERRRISKAEIQSCLTRSAEKELLRAIESIYLTTADNRYG